MAIGTAGGDTVTSSHGPNQPSHHNITTNTHHNSTSITSTSTENTQTHRDTNQSQGSNEEEQDMDQPTPKQTLAFEGMWPTWTPGLVLRPQDSDDETNASQPGLMGREGDDDSADDSTYYLCDDSSLDDSSSDISSYSFVTAPTSGHSQIRRPLAQIIVETVTSDDSDDESARAPPELGDYSDDETDSQDSPRRPQHYQQESDSSTTDESYQPSEADEEDINLTEFLASINNDEAFGNLFTIRGQRMLRIMFQNVNNLPKHQWQEKSRALFRKIKQLQPDILGCAEVGLYPPQLSTFDTWENRARNTIPGAGATYAYNSTEVHNKLFYVSPG